MKIEGNIQAKRLISGAATMLNEMHGLAANSAALAFYDGEDTFNFARLLNDQVICGRFQQADKIQNGDRLKAVVSRRGDVLFTHAIMNAKPHLISDIPQPRE